MNSTIAPGDWIQTHRAVVELVLPKGDLQKVLAVPEGQDLSSVSDSVSKLARANCFGARLFATTSRNVATKQVQKVIDKQLVKMKDLYRLDAEDFRKWSADTLALCQAVPGCPEIPPRREVSVAIHDMSVKMGVNSVADHIDKAGRAQVRNFAMLQGSLESLPGEKDVWKPAGGAPPQCVIHESLISKARSARQYLNSVVALEEDIDGDKILVRWGK